MAYANRQDLLRFGAQLARETGVSVNAVTAAAGVLIKLASKATRLAEDQCNRPERFDGEFESREQKIESAVAAVCRELGISARVNCGDPRGAAIKLGLPSGTTNDWGQEGFCVPQA